MNDDYLDEIESEIDWAITIDHGRTLELAKLIKRAIVELREKRSLVTKFQDALHAAGTRLACEHVFLDRRCLRCGEPDGFVP